MEPKNQQHEYPLVPHTDPLIHTILPKFDFSNPPIDPIELYNILGNCLVEYDGIGLSANQIGFPHNAFVIRSDPMIGMFNAKIVDFSEETIEMEEGCLTFPGIVVKVKRAKVIRVRYANPLGQIQTKKFQDMTARVIQHELDHMSGRTFGTRVSRLQLELAIKKARKQGFNYLINDFLWRTGAHT